LYARELSANPALRRLAMRVGLNVAWVLPDGSTRLDFPAGARIGMPRRRDAGTMILADHRLRLQAQDRNAALSPSMNALASAMP
jgi:hypothetical protein